MEGKRTFHSLPTSITQLPADILIDILCRLPVKTIISCRCVCTTLRNTIKSNPQFAQFHFTRSPTQVLIRGVCGLSRFLHLIELERERDSVYATRFKLPIGGLIVLNSCNGFLCLAKKKIPLYNPVVVYNPITGQYINLPTTRRNGFDEEEVGREVVSGFGCSSESNKYKIVRLVYQNRIHLCTEVYTLGESSWRTISNTDPPFPRSHGLSNGVFLNGVFHWVSADEHSSEYIIAFDFETEKFGTLPPPPLFAPPRYVVKEMITMGVLGCCLFVTDHDNRYTASDLWVMKDYGIQDSWIKVCFIGSNQPIRYLKNGSILVSCDDRELGSHDPGTENTSLISLPAVKLSNFKTTGYVPSFFTFKEIMHVDESCVQVTVCDFNRLLDF